MALETYLACDRGLATDDAPAIAPCARLYRGEALPRPTEGTRRHWLDCERCPPQGNAEAWRRTLLSAYEEISHNPALKNHDALEEACAAATALRLHILGSPTGPLNKRRQLDIDYCDKSCALLDGAKRFTARAARGNTPWDPYDD